MEPKTEQKLLALCDRMGIRAEKDVPMRDKTTFRIGGPADLFAVVREEGELQALIRSAKELEVPWFLLGNGSNLLVKDEGIRGLVIRLDGAFRTLSLSGQNRILCGAAVPLSVLCTYARDHALSGLEFAFGIPGTAGGAAFMNAGAYGGEMKDVLISCRHMDSNGEVGALSGEELSLSYRKSAYTGSKAVILSLLLELRFGVRDTITSGMEEFMRRRKEKQPLEFPSAGSVFKRPEGQFAGALIEKCGLKGRRVGGAQVSEKHAGFIINLGGATCRDVLTLVEEIQNTVLKETGIELECEIRTVG